MKEFKFKINGKDFETSVNELDDNKVEVTVNGKTYAVELPKEEKKVQPVVRPVAKPAVAPKETASAPKTAGGAGTVKSPLPGSIITIAVKEGQSVKRGDLLLTIESMKMENAIKAGKDGVVSAIHVQPGQSVLQGDALVDLN